MKGTGSPNWAGVCPLPGTQLCNSNRMLHSTGRLQHLRLTPHTDQCPNKVSTDSLLSYTEETGSAAQGHTGAPMQVSFLLLP